MEEKRIISTTVLFVFLAIVCFLSWLDIVCLVSILNPSDGPVDTGGAGGEEQFFMMMFAGMVLGMGVIFILALSVLIILISLICLLKSSFNTRVEYRPTKIINIVLSCCFASAITLAVISLILLRVL